jgi:hypothetical protein
VKVLGRAARPECERAKQQKFQQIAFHRQTSGCQPQKVLLYIASRDRQSRDIQPRRIVRNSSAPIVPAWAGGKDTRRQKGAEDPVPRSRGNWRKKGS